jgi:hypothetical protein
MTEQPDKIQISTDDLMDTIKVAMSEARKGEQEDMVKKLVFAGVIWRAERDAEEWEPADYRTGDYIGWQRTATGEPQLTIVLGMETRA